MDNFNDLKAIWLNVKTDGLPSSAQMIAIIKTYKNKTLKKLVWIIIAALAMILLMLFTGYVYNFKFLSSKIGEGFIVFSGLILIATNLNSLNRFYRLKVCSNKEYISFLEQTRLRQLFYFKYTQLAGLFFCFVGLILYLYELVYQNTFSMIISYLLLVVYFSFILFYLRPRNYKKGAAKLKQEIENARRVAQQF
ncbi:hypothetical protein I5M32_04320 [Pedobacter sp. SD-b]|uniref:Uncharacterized protein n=1 Tax=Pedobacter segetis TaxID=2793069 RepID=A0ABS1BH23_9SPHI|nr:hypothetical protein [Pedobacter segetis]MBK0382177.1 hypothetical protein [Pedobacter segetis]